MRVGRVSRVRMGRVSRVSRLKKWRSRLRNRWRWKRHRVVRLQLVMSKLLQRHSLLRRKLTSSRASCN